MTDPGPLITTDRGPLSTLTYACTAANHMLQVYLSGISWVRPLLRLRTIPSTFNASANNTVRGLNSFKKYKLCSSTVGYSIQFFFKAL